MMSNNIVNHVKNVSIQPERDTPSGHSSYHGCHIAMDIVACDYATQYPKAIPVKSIDAETIATKLMDLMSRVGICKKQSLWIKCQISQLLEEINKVLGIQGIKVMLYHPEMDGMVEQLNGKVY